MLTVVWLSYACSRSGSTVGADSDGFSTPDDCDDDADGDGHLSTECPAGDDCDDNDSGTYPGAPELCDDGRDNDCKDGDASCAFFGEYALADADAKVYVTEREEMASRFAVGDVDGDGTRDVFVAAETAASGNGGGHVLYGPFSGSVDAHAIGFAAYGSDGMRMAGRSIGVGDVNDDGYADIELGVPMSTSAFVELGPVTADFELADSSLVLDGSGVAYFGHGSDLADVDGDGIADVIIGAYGFSDYARKAGAVFVLHGPLSAGEVALVADHDAALYGSNEDCWAGRVVDAAADMDGDGIGDMMIQAFGYELAPPRGGAVAVVRGPFAGDLDLADADAWLIGEGFAGYGLAQADVDGDGRADALVGAPQVHDEKGFDPGAAYVVDGSTTGVIDLSAADVVVNGADYGYLGAALTAGDLDGDGVPELAVGAPAMEEGAGAVYVFYDAMPGTWDESDAGARLVGELDGDASGSAVLMTDLDNDGDDDLLIGAPDQWGAGALYVQRSRP